MRILIVNDDGVGAAQLPNLIRWCRKLGEVTTFVPKFEQSGKTLHLCGPVGLGKDHYQG